MIAAVLALAAAQALGDMRLQSASFSCAFERPGHQAEKVTGHIVGGAMRSADLGRFVGKETAQRASDPTIRVVGAANSYEWTIAGIPARYRIVLTDYPGLNDHIHVTESRFVGRHWGDSLVGFGLCTINQIENK